MIIGVKSPEINTLDSPSHGYTPHMFVAHETVVSLPNAQTNPWTNDLVHSWCTPGALLVHSWCFLVHSRCIFGALLVHSRCTLKVSRKPRELRKLTNPLPKGSLDLPFRNVWIAFPPTCKPEKEIAPLPKGSLASASERKSRSSAQKRLDRPRHYHIHHRRMRNQAAAEYP